jgi:hypothetical protein
MGERLKDVYLILNNCPQLALYSVHFDLGHKTVHIVSPASPHDQKQLLKNVVIIAF